jgi:hypothetical protein
LAAVYFSEASLLPIINHNAARAKRLPKMRTLPPLDLSLSWQKIKISEIRGVF